MNKPATIEDPVADAERPYDCDYAVDDCDAADHDFDGSSAPDLIEDQTDFPSLAFFPTMARPSWKAPIGPVRAHPVLIAVVISLVIHVNLAVGVYWVVRSLHVFVAASLQPVLGDGAMALGAIDHNGNGRAPGEAGPGSLTLGWSAPPKFAATPALDDSPALDASDAPPTPASAPPPAPPDPGDGDPTPALVAADVIVDPLQSKMLPVFRRPPPGLPGTPPSNATAPVDHAVASTRPAAPSPAVATGKQPVGNELQAMAAGSSSPAADKAGGLLRQAGPGGSNGKGGATSGAGGTAVTGRPGSLPGVKGPPLHADYPEDCHRRGETGRVVIQADIRADGSVASLKVLSDDGNRELARAALDAFEGRTFSPAMLDGRPIRSTLKCPFVFELRDKREGHE